MVPLLLIILSILLLKLEPEIDRVPEFDMLNVVQLMNVPLLLSVPKSVIVPTLVRWYPVGIVNPIPGFMLRKSGSNTEKLVMFIG